MPGGISGSGLRFIGRLERRWLTVLFLTHSKAVQTDPSFGPAWIAFGHAFAEEVGVSLDRHACSTLRFFYSSQGEHDQAMAAYSSAARLLPGSHLPQLYIGRAYASMNNYPMAERYLNAAVKMCGEILYWRRRL